MTNLDGGKKKKVSRKSGGYIGSLSELLLPTGLDNFAAAANYYVKKTKKHRGGMSDGHMTEKEMMDAEDALASFNNPVDDLSQMSGGGKKKKSRKHKGGADDDVSAEDMNDFGDQDGGAKKKKKEKKEKKEKKHRGGADEVVAEDMSDSQSQDGGAKKKKKEKKEKNHKGGSEAGLELQNKMNNAMGMPTGMKGPVVPPGYHMEHVAAEEHDHLMKSLGSMMKGGKKHKGGSDKISSEEMFFKHRDMGAFMGMNKGTSLEMMGQSGGAKKKRKHKGGNDGVFMEEQHEMLNKSIQKALAMGVMGKDMNILGDSKMKSNMSGGKKQRKHKGGDDFGQPSFGQPPQFPSQVAPVAPVAQVANVSQSPAAQESPAAQAVNKNVGSSFFSGIVSAASNVAKRTSNAIKGVSNTVATALAPQAAPAAPAALAVPPAAPIVGNNTNTKKRNNSGMQNSGMQMQQPQPQPQML